MRPLLEATIEARTETSVRGLVPLIAKRLALTDGDLAELLPSQRQPTFNNRLHWAKTYMERAGLLLATRRGYFTATARAASLLSDHAGPLSMKVLEQFPEYAAWKSRENGAGETDAPLSVEPPTLLAATPEESVESAVDTIERSLKAELLARIHAEPPAFFERFIRDLLLAMGYGGGLRERGFLTGGTGDGGIDGLIHEDALGLDAVYLQAKRYQPGANIPAHELRGFVGSMTAENASKGVFVTTSGFTRDATAFIDKVTQRIVLIDGDRLAELALRHGVGVRAQRTIVLQRVDEDYFASED